MTKRAAYTFGADNSGRKYWRSLEEFSDSPEFKEALHREFPEGASVLEDPVSRRSFIGLMGASLGLAGLTGCRRPEEKLLPYNKRPESLVEGNPQWYATVFPWGGTAIGLLVESHEGRPTKIEGNPSHPHSLGAANTYAQSSVLELYDPDRSQAPSKKGAAGGDWVGAASDLQARVKLADGKAGAGFAILTEAHRSPTLSAQLAALTQKWPQAKVYRYDPLSSQNERDGAKLAFGQALDPVYELADAKVIVAVDSDFLLTEGSPIRQSRQWADNRKVTDKSDQMNRMYAIESRFSVTGTCADHRLRLARKDIPGFVFALAEELSKIPGVSLSVPGLPAGKLDEKGEKWVKELAIELGKNRGTAVLMVGSSQPPAVHAVAALINNALGNVGKTVKYVKPFDATSDGPDSIAALASSMNKGEVETLLILGGNPVFDAPADSGFAGGLSKVGFSAHLSEWVDETGLATTWHYPRSHALESWGDAVANDGTAALVQPLIAPLFPSKSDIELVELVLGGARKGYEIVQATWKNNFGATFEMGWRRALHDGLIVNTTQAGETVTAATTDFGAAMKSAASPASGYEISFHPDSHAWNGRFANCGWQQEMPDPMTKESWGNAALLSPNTAKELDVTDGDTITISAAGKSIEIPIVIAPGQADKSIGLTIGQGRTVGTTAKDIGTNTFPIRTVAGFYGITGATVAKAGNHTELARTQEHHTMEGRPLVREATLVQFRSKPNFAKEMVTWDKINLFAEEDTPHYNGLKWGMAIDLNSCIGCNACMIACQSENNIPLTGKDGVIRGREMHWIRVDRYYQGEDPEEPTAVLQPIGCQQCENAPCELVCPVAATTHSPEGLNDMAYNRCVGTRYCANNCPYKVRRFNFFFYNRDVPELKKMQMNPNVTVRSRGVMEKCSYCVQRIQEGKIAAKRENRFIERAGEQIPEIKDGDVISACAQTCPTNAIKFGDLNDPHSEVTRAANNPRSYALLGELNTRPRTSFLARIRNPNPSLEKA
jgi:molybdopterin-containing oxidoreductase family iron-sulfur binding subunit